jgi:hypothetical protein
LWSGGLVACLGIWQQSPVTINVATLVVALAWVLFDLLRMPQGGVTAITIFSVISVVTAVSNIIGLSSADTPQRSLYFHYAVVDHLVLASLLQLAHSSIPVIAFWAVTRASGCRNVIECFVPGIRSSFNSRVVVRASIALAAIPIVLNLTMRVHFVGHEIFLLTWLPNLCAFVLARIGTAQRNTAAMTAGLVIALASAVAPSSSVSYAGTWPFRSSPTAWEHCSGRGRYAPFAVTICCLS